MENTLTIKDLDFLTSRVRKGPVGRSKDKTYATRRLRGELINAYNSILGERAFRAVMACDSCEKAVEALAPYISGEAEKGHAIEIADRNRQEAKKQEKKQEKKLVPAGKRGRPTGLTGKKAWPLTEGVNPRRQNTHGWRSMEIIMNNPGISVEAFVERGGRLVDLRWDIKHKHVKVQ